MSYFKCLCKTNENRCDILKLGLDVFLEKEYNDFIGKRIGLITNMTGVNQKLIPTIDLFHEHPHINLTTLYGPEQDRKSTRLNSSHVAISYAVFCLKTNI